MHIERLQVEGGFLDGLDLKFESNLNVLIGGRGVGKTAVVELIRFCLGAPNLDPELRQLSIEHALGVLGDGVAQLTVTVNGERRSIHRSALDRKAITDLAVKTIPLIFSQREVETLGRTARGRLNLIDSFLSKSAEKALLATSKVRSLSAEIRDLCGELDELREQLESRASLVANLNDLKATQASLGAQTSERASSLVELEKTQQEVNKLTLAEHSLGQARERVERWLVSLPANPGAVADLGSWPAGADPLKDIRTALVEDAAAVARVAGNARSYANRIEDEIRNVTIKKDPLENQLRKIRQVLEEEQVGSGRIAREISRLEESVARFSSLEQAAIRKQKRADAAHAERLEILKEVEQDRQEIYEQRKAIAARLNKALQPRVKIDVKHSVDVAEYEAAIIEALRGSSLRYNEVAPSLSRAISPSELCEIVYQRRSKVLAEILKISEERSVRLITALRDAKFESVLLAPIHDEVEFYLLDGVTYKHVDELSIGQRCTVVLSIVLENVNVGLIIDQPEDHLDNEFVADTLIRAIRNREILAQTIVSTHNANIPVLGEASMVVQLDSNGQRGFVKCAGSLKSQAVVDSILTIMEGGNEAFSKRANFYGEGA